MLSAIKKLPMPRMGSFFVSLVYAWLMQLTGHWPAHAPQSMQVSGLISYWESPWEIAPTGHCDSQEPQLMQSLLITYAISKSPSCATDLARPPLIKLWMLHRILPSDDWLQSDCSTNVPKWQEDLNSGNVIFLCRLFGKKYHILPCEIIDLTKCPCYHINVAFSDEFFSVTI